MDDDIRKRNAKELQRAWKQFLKERKQKDVKQGKQTKVREGN